MSRKESALWTAGLTLLSGAAFAAETLGAHGAANAGVGAGIVALVMLALTLWP